VNVLSRITRRGKVTPAGVERAIAAAFDFLVAEDGFELTTNERFDDGAAVGYRNRAAGVAILVRARESEGVWAGIGSLDADGRLRPLTFESYQLGHWRDLATVGVEHPEADDLFVAVPALGASLRKVRSG
jgi:hypothetical protein